MFSENLPDVLFVEISLSTILLLAIMLYNNIVLYKVGLKDKLSIILALAIFLPISDLIWHFVDGSASCRILNYACGYVYVCDYMLLIMMFALFSLERYGLTFKSKKWNMLIFAVPCVLEVIFCLSTPWTEWMFAIDKADRIQYMAGIEYFLTPVCCIYLAFSLFPTLYFLITRRKKNREQNYYARNLLIFALLALGIDSVAEYVLEVDYDYLMPYFSWALGLVYFTTMVNTKRFVKNREKITAVESDLAIATKIQLGALPAVKNALPTHSDVSVFASMNAAKEVGGDFYDFFEIDDTHVCFVIADVSGKGVPAALFMMVVKTMIRDHASMKRSTAEIFNNVNRLLCENNAEEMFATAWIGILDTETKKMKCTNAGHNAVCFAKKSGSFEFLKQRHGTFLAGFDFTQYKEAEIQFESGDCLFLYTDGLTEAHNASAELYGEKRLLDKLNSIETRGDKRFLKQIVDDVNVFSEGTDPFDDLTMMVVKVD